MNSFIDKVGNFTRTKARRKQKGQTLRIELDFPCLLGLGDKAIGVFATNEGMSTADPPGLPSSPRSGSKGAMKGSDQEARIDLEKANHNQISMKGLDLGEKTTENDGSRVSSPRSIDVGSTRGGSNQDATLGGSKGSWIRAVQGQKVLKKYDVEVTMKDGIGSVMVPEEITKDVAPLWDDFLIGKFLDNAPHIAKIHAIVNKIWTPNDKERKIEVFEVNPTMMKFEDFQSADRNRF
ncbi:hypothetical protein Bca101_064293 [Brassica carinata]